MKEAGGLAQRADELREQVARVGVVGFEVIAAAGFEPEQEGGGLVGEAVAELAAARVAIAAQTFLLEPLGDQVPEQELADILIEGVGSVGLAAQIRAAGRMEILVQRLQLVFAPEREKRGEDGHICGGALGEQEVAEFAVTVLEQPRSGCLRRI